ncbi:MAG: hypothetical protein KatS3mg034_1579 [Vicingaceae bacterium]|nr:MAG: hypothetical protein KatS3mg034_1579 [Vicingaceae bacterium]
MNKYSYKLLFSFKLVILLIFCVSGLYSQRVFYFTNRTGQWDNPENWISDNNEKSLPGKEDIIVFHPKYFKKHTNSTIKMSKDIKINTLKIYVSNLHFIGEGSLHLKSLQNFGENNLFDIPSIIIENPDENELPVLENFQGKIILRTGDSFKPVYHWIFPEAELVFEKGLFVFNRVDIVCRKITVAKKAGLVLDNNRLYVQTINDDFKKIEQNNDSKIYFLNPGNQNSHLTNVNKISLEQYKLLTSVSVQNDTVCANSCIGSLTANINCTCNNGCSIDWIPGNPPGDGTPTIYNLCPGSYQIKVTDNCTGQNHYASATVVSYIPISIDTQTVINATCKDSCNGSISLTVVGSTFTYTFNWSTGFSETTSGTSSISNLCAGNYWVHVYDGVICDTVFYFTVNEPNYVDPNATGYMTLCFGSCDGTAVSNPTGGTPPYVSYQWNDPLNQTTSTATNLCPGTYTVTVTDANGCIGVDTVTILSPQNFNLDTIHVNVSCGGACDATIGVNVLSGGTPPYTHSWSNGANTPIISNLCPGVYSDTIRDANNCDTIVTFVVTEPAPLSIFTNVYPALCKGQCNGSAAAYVSGGTPPYSYNWSPGNMTTDSVSGLCAGQYIVNVTDANGCGISDTIIITEPDSVKPNPSFTNPTCPNVCNGSAVSNPTGGTPPYSYLWTPGNQTTQSINSLCSGTYYITVTDSKGCTGIDSVIITPPAPITIQLSTNNASCFGVCNGSAQITNISGGTPGYTWVWSPGGFTGNPFNNLCAGNYSVTVTDANGCQKSQNFTITAPSDITFNIIKNDVSCNGACNGSATITNISGGTPPYVSIQWSNGQNGPTATGLCTGSYTVTVTDANGCQKTMNVLINEPPAMNISFISSNVTCYGLCNGSINTTVTGGVAPYTYSWSPGGQNTPNISGLCAGWHILTVTDAFGCQRKDSVFISEPNQLNANATFTNVSCNGNCDGTATALPTGGTPPYTFLWTPGNQTTQSISNLCGGQYIVTVTDNNGCTDKDTVNIVNPQVLNVTTSQTAASCGSICNGTATANVSGGTPPYTFNWSNGQTGQTATNLCAGTYTVTVTDSNGCSKTDTVTINNLVTIQITADTITQACNGNCNGSATAVASGGVAPYTYYWLPPVNQNGPVATGLCPGTYTVQATDANGCTATGQITIPVAPTVLVNNPVITNPLCHGDCNGSINANTTGGTPPYSWSWSPGGQTTQSISNLCAGTYIVTTTDANNCQAKDTIVITQPDSLKITANVIQDVTCNGNCNGWIAINISGGISPYTITWNNGSNNDTITNLCPGIYTVTVTDANGCSKSASFTITQPTLLQGNILPVNPTCNGQCNGQAGAMISGGTPPYSYFWSPGGQTTQTITNLCAGNYSVFVQDQNGCSITLNTTLNNPSPITVTINGGDASCNGNCDGTASATVSGGTPPYNYSWSNGSTTSNISNLCPGTYFLTVTDANGCTGNANITITEPTNLSVTLSSTNETCNGSCNGSATATPSGGTPPYQFNWSNGATTSNISNLCPGTYTVTVTDANGCYFQGNVTIQPSSPIQPNATITQANCGACDGVISLSPSGGTPPYSYLWSPGGQTTSSISNLCAGVYSVTITDFSGCSQTFSFGVNNSNGPNGATITTNNATCYGSCDGNANAIAIGGTPPYTYQWNDPMNQTGSTALNLCAGSYFVTITDANGCIYNAPVQITQPDSLQAQFNNTNETCSGACDGTSTIIASGGNPPYTYSWSNGSTGSSVSGLCAGSYSVTVTDTKGCSKTFNTTISPGSTLIANVSFTNGTCSGSCNGSANVTPSGGTPPYSVLWSNGQSSLSINNLCAGTYTVTVTDANGCQATNSVTITEPSQIQANISTVNATCGVCDGSATVFPSGGTSPYSYNWNFGATTSSVNALCAGTYSVTITDANGCKDTFLVAISNNNGPSISINTNNASCNGVCNGSASVTINSGNGPFSYLWTPGNYTTPSVSGLCAGQYTIQVTDGSGCITTQTFTIGQPQPIQINLTTSPISCNGNCDGSIIPSVSGGTPPYSYNWNNGSTSPSLSGLCAGNYTLTVTDANGCVASASASLTQPNSLTIQMNATNVSCSGGCNGSATATPIGGTPPYNYQWSNGSTGQTATGLCAGVYTVTVTDANGCTATANINIGDGNPITITSNITSAACGQCNGSAVVNAAGGNGPPYSYYWSPIGTNGNSQNNLCPGSYTLTVTDNIGCSQNFIITINQSNGPLINAYADSVSCYGTCDGTAWVLISGGTPPFNIVWNNPGLSTNDTIFNQCAGTYSVVVQDNNGCISVDTVSISGPNPLSSSFSATNPLCNGDCNGSITANPSGGNGGYSFLWMPGNMTTSSISNLCAGSYTLILSDLKGCIDTFNYTLTQPAPMNINISTNPTSCDNTCNGTATAVVSGGTGPYSFNWSPGNITTNPAVNLCQGTYTLTVTDANGCIQTSSTNIAGPAPLQVTLNSTNPSCPGICNGSITANVTGGTGPYIYLWNNGLTTSTINNLCAGSYSVTITDANGCSTSASINLNSPGSINDNATLNQPLCGQCNGSISLNPQGGTGPYAYSWNTGQTSSSIANLCAGIYTVTITDQATGCSYNFTYYLNSQNGPQVSISKTDETCFNSCNGTATATVTGNGPFAYLWTPGGYTSSSVTNLCAGSYILQVTDINGCITYDTVTINTNQLQVSINNYQSPSCAGNCDGWATASASGGVPSYSYSWNPGGQTSQTANNLCGGTYTVQVTDQNGCSGNASVNLVSPQPLSVTLSVNNSLNCYNSCNGSILANVTGGTPPYTYTWSNGQTGNPVNNLCAGNYSVTVTDANGCTASANISLTAPNPILSNATLNNPLCGQCNGSITLNPSGGTPPYTYSWSNGSNAQNLINLCSGIYTVTITDSKGCNANFTFPLGNSNGPQITISKNDVLCYGDCNGSLTANVISGNGPFTYQWNPGAINSNTANNLCPGIYTITVTDANGCKTIQSDTIKAPDQLILQVSSTTVSCGGNCDGTATATVSGGTPGYTYQWNDPQNQTTPTATNLCAGNYSVTVTDNNGCQVSGNVNITSPGNLSIDSVQIQPTSCSSICDGSATVFVSGGTAPYQITWSNGTNGNTATNLCRSTYQITVTDASGCTITSQIQVGTLLDVIADAGRDTAYCDGQGPAIFVASTLNATVFAWYSLPGFVPIHNNDTLNVSPVGAGYHCFALIAENGLCKDTDTVCVNIRPLPWVDAGPDKNVIAGNSTTIQATASGTGISYVWSPDQWLNTNNGPVVISTPEQDIMYYVTVTDMYGCSNIDSVKVKIIPKIVFPDGISPNGDGKNDVWIIDNIHEYPNNIVEIYNRWGELLFRAQPYQNNWDGTYKGKPLPVGTYYYIINLNEDGAGVYTGPITIVR